MCEPILVTILKVQPHCSQSSCENAIPSSSVTSPSASYKEVHPSPHLSSSVCSLQSIVRLYIIHLPNLIKHCYNTVNSHRHSWMRQKGPSQARFVLFVIGAFFAGVGEGGYSNLLLLHLRLKHRGNVFFGQDARKDNSPRAISCYQDKTTKSVSIFKETIKNTEKDKVVTLQNN